MQSWRSIKFLSKHSKQPKTIAEQTLTKIQHSFGFTSPTLVQKTVIPLFLSNKDVVVKAQTGSGKTFSFLLPIIEMIQESQSSDISQNQSDDSEQNRILAIILAPSRELVLQINQVLNDLKPLNISSTYLIGGSSIKQEAEDFYLSPKQIIVSTIGRLYQIINSRDSFSEFRALLTRFQALVIDEADRLLESSFSCMQLQEILKLVPKNRRTGLFSATMNAQITEVIKMGMKNPYYIEIIGEEEQKSNCLVKQLTPTEIKSIAQQQQKQQLPSTLYSHYQKKRRNQYQAFKSDNQGSVLMTTDLSARGIDIDKLEWIIQFDPPKNLQMYVHRSGRTARAGCTGNNLIYLRENEMSFVDLLQLQSINCKELDFDNDDEDKGEFRKRLIKEMLNDRANWNRGSSAFVSFVRYYKEHDLKYIFKFNELNDRDLADSFCLNIIPKVKQFKRQSSSKRQSFRVEDIPFKNKNQEKQIRQNKLKRIAKLQRKKNQQVQEAQKICKRQKKQRKRSDKRKVKRQNQQKQWDQLAKETRLLKKLKKGKISEKEFEDKMNNCIDDLQQ